MKNQRPTVVLNKTNSDGFLDLNSSKDFAEVIKVLNNIMKVGEKDDL